MGAHALAHAWQRLKRNVATGRALNHLAHFVLAPASDAARMGTLLGDFARGTDLSAWPLEVEQAIRLHRRVDAFTDSHTVVLAAKGALPTVWRRYAGILLDVYFDHVLINDWARWHDAPLAAYASDAHASLARIAPALSEPARGVCARMGEHAALTTGATPAGMAHVLARIGARLARPQPLADALPTLIAAHDALAEAFESFFPALRAEARDYLAGSTLSTRPSALSVSR